MAWKNKGYSLSKLNRYEEALTSCDKAIEINPQDAGAWFGEGVVLRKLGRHEEASAAFNKAIGINPQYARSMGQ